MKIQLHLLVSLSVMAACCLAILRPNGDAGKITLTAEADGLKPTTIHIQIK